MYFRNRTVINGQDKRKNNKRKNFKKYITPKIVYYNFCYFYYYLCGMV